MSTEDKLNPIRDGIRELKEDVRELRKLEPRITALETINEERGKRGTESNQTASLFWQKVVALLAVIAIGVSLLAIYLR